jgi:hypothetical protein
MLQLQFPSPANLVGTFRRFGAVGPVYEVVAIGRELDSDVVMRVRVLDSGEEVEYRYTAILDDPKEG